jgi:O-acetyl-ADP-ribose deacetylase (regulator of RNase III)
MPILGFIFANIFPVFGNILQLALPVLGSLLGFTLSRFSKIPRYIKLLRLLYEDTATNSQARKVLTLGFLCLGTILSFMAHSIIPGTAVPILGGIMAPLATMLTVIIILVTFDFIFNLNEEYYFKRLQDNQNEDLTDIIDDLTKIHELFGKSWGKITQSLQNLLPILEKELSQRQMTFEDLTNRLHKQIEALLLYLRVQERHSLSVQESNSEKLKREITDGLAPLTKKGVTFMEGAVTGSVSATGAAGIASSLFVQAGFWTPLQGVLGLSGGIAVGATAYTLLTVVAPVGIGALTTIGVMQSANHFRTRQERQNMSAFLGDVFIAALPMLWTNEACSKPKEAALNKMIMNSILLEKDQERVYQAKAERKTFDDVLRSGLLLDQQARQTQETPSNKEKIKHRLLLSIAWELAKADGRIDAAESQLHDYMAKSLPTIDSEERSELRLLMNLESDPDLEKRIVLVQDDLTAQRVDAIVNSAEPSLSLTKWKGLFQFNRNKALKVDQAVYQAAGPSLAKECQALSDCQPGQAKITDGYTLPATKVIHTVTPIWQEGKEAEVEAVLAQCYRNSLALAQEYSLQTIAFPALGTGTGQFPTEVAAQIAIQEIKQFLCWDFSIEQIKLVCFDSDSYQCYQQILESTEQPVVVPIPVLEEK